MKGPVHIQIKSKLNFGPQQSKGPRGWTSILLCKIKNPFLRGDGGILEMCHFHF